MKSSKDIRIRKKSFRMNDEEYKKLQPLNSKDIRKILLDYVDKQNKVGGLL